MNNVDRHSECIELIAGYINETLPLADSARVTAHLQQCSDCRGELQLARALQNHFGRQPSAPSTLQLAGREQRNFERLWTRIETTQFTPVKCAPVKLIVENTAPPTSVIPKVKVATNRWWLPLASAAAVVLLIVVNWRYLSDMRLQQQPVSEAYHTLANAAPPLICGQIRAQFVDNISAGDLQTLLHSVNAKIVNGPTAHGVYTLRAEQPDSALQRLRLHPAVLLAEPTDC